MEPPLIKPTLVADTASQFCKTVADFSTEYNGKSNSVVSGQNHNAHDSNYFREAQWSPDGTCIITNSADYGLRTFVLPRDLLTSPSIQTLIPFATTQNPEPIYSFSPYPFYNLADPNTTLALCSIRDHPISLVNCLLSSSTNSDDDEGKSSGGNQHATTKVASYQFIDPLTEAFHSPHSLIFTSAGTHFLAGTESLIAAFDLSRDGEGPVERYRTIPSKRKKIVGGGVGMKGIVSALSLSGDGMLAAGTFTRYISLYANEGRGERVAVFGLPTASSSSSAAYGADAEDTAGAGVTSVKWSPCSRYLYAAERRSDCVLMYDVRVSGRQLGWLSGRCARTNQRLGVEMVPTATAAGAAAQGHEIWAGGTDGMVRVWQNPYEKEGKVGFDLEWRASTDPVASATAHPCGTVIATCSGERKGIGAQSKLSPSTRDESPSPARGISTNSSPVGNGESGLKESNADGAGTFDNTLKLWSLN